MRGRVYIVALCVAMLGQFVWGQQLCGVVMDERGQGLPGAVVKLYTSDSSDLLRAYTIAASDGKWCFSRGVSGRWIVVHMLGYEEYRGAVPKSSLREPVIIRLRPRDFSLQEVTVPGKRPAVVARGDTVEYSVAQYRSQTDRTLGEVLNKMEGFEVTREGEIKYQSRRVNKVLIEGRDILNDQHKIIVESIRPIDVKKIQIIGNYRPFHEHYFKRWSEKVAMNIVLTEGAKFKLKGDAKEAGGISKRYEGVVNLYEVGDSLGYSSFVRSNNVGEAVLTANDFLHMESDVLRALNKSKGNIDELVPQELLRSESEQSSTDHLLAFNREIESDADSREKFSLLAHYFIRKGTSKIDRWTTEEANVLHLRRERVVRFPFIYAVYNRKVHAGEKSLYEIDVPVRYRASTTVERLGGGAKPSEVESALLGAKRLWSVAPALYYSAQVNARLRTKLEAHMDIKRQSQGVDIEATTPLFGSKSSAVFQRLSRQQMRYATTMSLKYKAEHWSVVGKLPISLSIWSIALRDDLVGGVQRENFHTKALEVGPVIEINYRRGALRLRSTLGWPHSVIYHWDRRYSGHFFQPSLRVMYAFHKLHRMHVHFSRVSRFLDPSLRFTAAVIEDGSTLKTTQIAETDRIQRTTTFTLGYFNLLIDRGMYLYLNLSYAYQEHALFPVVELQDNYLLYRTEIARAQQKWGGRMSIKQKLFQNRLILQVKLSWKDIRTEKEGWYRLDMCNWDVEAQTNFKKGMNLRIQYGLHGLEQAIGERLIRYRTHRIGGSVQYAKGRVKGHTNVGYHLRQGKGLRTGFTVWNIGLQYRIRSRWECYIEGRDLLNLKAAEVINYRFFPSYYEIARYRRFPGSVVMGLRWTL